MIVINKPALQYIVCGVLLLLSEHIFGINYITLSLVFFSIIYTYFTNNIKCALFLLLLFSALSKNGVNIYTFSLSGMSLFYIICTVLLLFVLVRGEKHQINVVSKPLFIYLILFLFNIWFSINNFIESPTYFFKDLLILVLIPFSFYILFKGMSNRDIFFVFYILISIKILTSLALYLSGLTLEIDENLNGAMAIDNTDELSAFFTILLLSVIMFSKHPSKLFFNIILFVTCVGLCIYGLGFLGLGSQVVLMIILVILLFFYKHKIIFLYFSPVVFFIIVFLYPGINIHGSALLVYKINNIIGLISNLDADSVYLIPHSPQVRVIELINIFNCSWYELLFGHGLGGYFTDEYFVFNPYIGKFDFSDFEIMTGRFYNPHNVAFGVLKIGIVWWLFISYLFYSTIRLRDNEAKIFLLVAIFVLFLNFGFAIKTSILLAMIFIVMHNSKMVMELEKRKHSYIYCTD
ncbi:hypothetical protein ACW5WN_05880 [Aeromonas lacus]